MRYPIGVQDFGTIIEDGFVYVDKTDLVYELSKLHVCFLSRPRRFGKSLLISTLDAYFSGKKELFKGLKIDELEIVETDNDVFIFEFKLDGSAKEALKQIENRQYAFPYLDDKRSVHKIGVNISSISRTVDDWKVE